MLRVGNASWSPEASAVTIEVGPSTHDQFAKLVESTAKLCDDNRDLFNDDEVTTDEVIDAIVGTKELSETDVLFAFAEFTKANGMYARFAEFLEGYEKESTPT